MNGHKRRRISKMKNIKSTAVRLFNQYGINKVSMEEIAREADVSKVTIYKYFESKEGLIKDIEKSIFQEKIKQAEDLIASPVEFLEKLKLVIEIKSSAADLLQGKFVRDIFKNNSISSNEFHQRIKKLTYEFIQQGKDAGCIDKELSNELIYFYIEIFNAGIEAKADMLSGLIKDQSAFDELINLYFYGIINKKFL